MYDSKSCENLSFFLNDYDEQHKFVCLRLSGSLTYTNVISADYSHTEDQLNDQFDKIHNDLQEASYFFKAKNLILAPSSLQLQQSVLLNTCADLYKSYFATSATESSDKSVWIKSSLSRFIPVDILKSVSVNKNEYYSPLFTNHKGICKLQAFNIPIDCLILVDPTTKITNLHDIINEKLNLYLQTVKQCYLTYYQNESNFKAQPYHYLIEGSQNSIITLIYPSNHTEESLAGLRQSIHKALDLPTDRPLFRRSDAFQFNPDQVASSPSDDLEALSAKYLINPHLSAKPSNIQNGKQSLVKGNYVYFHYMQDNMNDSGWGCAYRSLQTIFSWYKLQGFTKRPVPTHREIQQTLVNLGDKSKEFVGSSKWIGSFEISYCLNSMLGVESKMISVSRGSELNEKARELQYHFDTVGTPVMIGGGVLAHTIIGVDFDEMTGDVKYLILDPHYTGSEDIKTIVTKGWVGWKEIKFWNENAFFNLCCPQKPNGV